MKLFRLFVVACILTFCAGRAAAQEQETPAPKTYKIYAVCDAHLDTQWNWDIQTTINEYVWNTISQNLFLLKKYPEYVFNFEGGVKYAWMKEYYPEQYEEMKKFIEEGNHGGKGSEAHKATVVGDTVGDPFKDTSGPSLNILIKLMSMVAIVMAGLTVAWSLF